MEISEIIESVDILEYISQYCDFEERGGEYWALSPLKEENTPSFSVDKAKQLFYDFSTGAGGNVLSFIELYHKCNFPAALTILKKYAHISDTDIVMQQRLQTTKIARRFKYKPKESAIPKQSILSPDHMDRYEFNKEKIKPWNDEGIPWDTLYRFGVRFDPFSERIVYPIKNFDGDIISVCGRTLDPDFKDKRIRKYTYFQKIDTLNTLYGFSDNERSIVDTGEIIIFEGAKSVMLADSWGFKNTAALLTSHLNDHQLKFLIKLGVRTVFALDENVNLYNDENIMKLTRFVRVDAVINRKGLLGDKMAPVDAGLDVWKSLYERRKRMN